MSHQVYVTIKIDKQLKEDIQKMASKWRISLSAIIENGLHQFCEEQQVLKDELKNK